jgi:hypothetical protein
MSDLRKLVTAEHLIRALFFPWRYREQGKSFRWETSENRRYALRASDPAKGPEKEIPRCGCEPAGVRSSCLFSSLPERASPAHYRVRRWQQLAVVVSRNRPDNSPQPSCTRRSFKTMPLHSNHGCFRSGLIAAHAGRTKAHLWSRLRQANTNVIGAGIGHSWTAILALIHRRNF